MSELTDHDKKVAKIVGSLGAYILIFLCFTICVAAAVLTFYGLYKLVIG